MQRLRGYIIKLGCGLGVSLALSSLGALPARAQDNFPVPVPPPATGDLPVPIHSTQPLSSPPVPVPAHPAPATDPVPVVSVPQANAVVVPVAPDVASKTAALTVPLLITQWRTHQRTPQEAWDKGVLKVEDLIYILDHSLDYWGGFYWEKDVALRREIVALLAQHGGDKIAKPETLSPFVRLWLADYYESLGDARTLPLCEGILSEIKTPVKGEGALAFQAIERIGWYHRDKGEYEQGAQAWLRMMDYHADIGWWTPDALVEAARLFFRAGSSGRAQELYAKVRQYDDGWANGLAVTDQASELMTKGQYEIARKLLQQPVTGHDAEQIQPALISKLAYSYYRAGDFEQARHYSQEAIAQYKSLSHPRRDVGLEAAVSDSEQRLQWIERWAQEPIIVAPQKLRVIVEQGSRPAEPLTRRLTVRTLQEVSLTATADRPEVIVGIEGREGVIPDPLWAVDEQLYVQNKLVIQIAPHALEKSFDATVTVSSTKFPAFQAHVPLHIEVQRLMK